MLATAPRSNTSPILLLLQKQLVKYAFVPPASLPPERCYFVADGQVVPTNPQADQIVTIEVGELMPKQAVIKGAGRSDVRVVQRCNLRLWLRFNVDEEGTADKWLNDPQLGIIPWRDALVNAVCTFIAFDGVGNADALPARVLTASKPVRGWKAPNGDWGSLTLPIELEYVLAVDQSRIA